MANGINKSPKKTWYHPLSENTFFEKLLEGRAKLTPKAFLGLMDALFFCTVVLMRCTLEYSKVGEILLLNHSNKSITGISIKTSVANYCKRY